MLWESFKSLTHINRRYRASLTIRTPAQDVLPLNREAVSQRPNPHSMTSHRAKVSLFLPFLKPLPSRHLTSSLARTIASIPRQALPKKPGSSSRKGQGHSSREANQAAFYVKHRPCKIRRRPSTVLERKETWMIPGIFSSNQPKNSRLERKHCRTVNHRQTSRLHTSNTRKARWT